MSSVETITDAIAQLPAEDAERVRVWLNDRAEREWDEQIEADEVAGRLDTIIDAALAEHKAGQTRPR